MNEVIYQLTLDFLLFYGDFIAGGLASLIGQEHTLTWLSILGGSRKGLWLFFGALTYDQV
jgi:hypothetical protein